MADLLTEIKEKLKIIEELEPSLKIIAIESGKPLLSRPIHKKKIQSFEKKFEITLPEDFVMFYRGISNGSAGPDLGLYSLEQIEEKIDPEKVQEVFPLRKPWYNRPNEIPLSNDDYIPGTIPISHFGEGMDTFLVLNGEMRGIVWADDRKYRSDHAVIYPYRGESLRFKQLPKLTFLQWYLDWVECCFERLHKFQEKKEQFISQISNLTSEVKLNRLNLTRLPSFPDSMPNLQLVELKDNSLVSLEGFPLDLPNLKKITLHKCGITDLRNFPQKLPNLLHLDLGGLKLKDLSGLPSSLPKLRSFWMFRTTFESMKGFPTELPELRGLTLSFSNISNLFFLPKTLPSLEYLDLNGCNLESLEGLPTKLPNLKVLDLKNSSIKHPESIPDWVKPFIKT